MIRHVMSITMRTSAGLFVAAALCGCAHSRQAEIDDAHHRGHISAAERKRLSDEFRAEQFAAMEKAQLESSQQPRSNPKHRTLITPQPIEDPFFPGRPVDEDGIAEVRRLNR
jgi:hypothetical protein